MNKCAYILLLTILFACSKKISVNTQFQNIRFETENYDTILVKEISLNDSLLRIEKYYNFNRKDPQFFNSTEYKVSYIIDSSGKKPVRKLNSKYLLKNGLCINKSIYGYLDTVIYKNDKIDIAINHWPYQKQKQVRKNNLIFDSTWNSNGNLTLVIVYSDSMSNDYENEGFSRINQSEEFILNVREFGVNGKIIKQTLSDSYPKTIKSKQNCAYGLQNKYGKWILPDEYEFITEFINDKAIVFKNQQYGVVDTLGNFFLPMQAYSIFDPELFDSEYYGIKKKDLCYYSGNKNCYVFQPEGKGKGLLHLKNGIIIKPEFNNINLDFWSKNILILEKNKGELLYDTLGNQLHKGEVKYVINNKYWSKGFDIGVIQTQKNNKYGAITFNGKLIFENKYNYFDTFSEDSIIIASNSKDTIVDFYNIKGEKLHSVKADWYNFIAGNRIVLTYRNKFKLLDSKAFEYLSDLDSIYLINRVHAANKSLFVTNKNGVFLIVDTNGINHFKDSYQYIEVFNTTGRNSQTYLIVQKNNLWGIIDLLGNVKLPIIFKYRDGLNFSKDSIIVSFYNKEKSEAEEYIFNDFHGKGLVRKGKFVLKPIFASIEINKNYIELTKFDSSVALANLDGLILFEGKSKRIYPVKDGFARLDFEDNSTVFNFKGKELYKVQGSILNTYKDFVYTENKNHKVGVFDKKGKVIIDTIYGQISQFDTINKIIWATTKSFGHNDDEPENEEFSFSFEELFDVGWDLYNDLGELIIKKAKYPSFFRKDDLSIAINWNDSAGILNKDLKWVLGPQKCKIEKCNSLFFVYNEDKFQIFNNLGKALYDHYFDTYLVLKDKIVVYQNGIPSLLNSNGDLLIKGLKNQFSKSRLQINSFMYSIFKDEYLDEYESQINEIYINSDYDNLRNDLNDFNLDTNIQYLIFDFLEKNISKNESDEDGMLDYKLLNNDVYDSIIYFPQVDLYSNLMHVNNSGEMYLSSEYRILSFTDSVVSILKSDTYSNRYSTQLDDIIFNIKIINGKLTNFNLNNILILNRENSKRINSIISKKILTEKIENEQDICNKSDENYINKLKKFFYFNENGIVLYFGNDNVIRETFNDESEEDILEIEISYEELNGMFKSNIFINKK